MRYSLYEGFTDTSQAASGSAATYKDSKVAGICQRSDILNSNRAKFIGTLTDMVTQLTAIDGSSGMTQTLSRYKTQMVRINDLSDYLAAITSFFNDSSSGTANSMQLLTELLTLSGVNVPTSTAAIQALLDKAESLLSTLYSVTSKVDAIRNLLINFLNITHLNVVQSRLICLKKQFLDPSLQASAQTLDNQLRDFVAALNTWCAAIATADFSNKPVVPTNTCPTLEQYSALSACTTDSCYSGFMQQFNPTAQTDQPANLKNCLGTAGSQQPACVAKWVGTCSGNTWSQVGPVAGGGNGNGNANGNGNGDNTCQNGNGGSGGNVGNVGVDPNPTTGPCQDLYNACLAAGGTVQSCDALRTSCLVNPTKYCPPPAPTCPPNTGDTVLLKTNFDTYQQIKQKFNSGIDRIGPNDTGIVCPKSAMTYDPKANEYDITTHPNIGQWGVQNSAWDGAKSWLPDYVAQKMNLSNRCKDLNSFDISAHKDLVNFVPKGTYDEVKAKETNYRSRLKTCETAFKPASCTVEGFAVSAANATLTDDDSCPLPDDAGMTFDIKTHAQYPTLMKNVTSNDKLPDVCRSIVDCSKYPIENNADIGKYVLRSSIPPPPPPQECKKLSEYNLKDHPDFATYDQSWATKDKLDVQAATEKANAACKQQLGALSQKDACGNPTKCKALAEYNLKDHPDFPSYTEAWKEKLIEYAGKDKDGNVIKCKAPEDLDLDDIPAVKQLKADMETQCQAQIADVKADAAKVQDSLGSVVSRDMCGNPQKCKALDDYDISQHKDFQLYVPKTQCPSPSGYDITTHPEIKKYVLRTSVPHCKDITEYKLSDIPGYAEMMQGEQVERDRLLQQQKQSCSAEKKQLKQEQSAAYEAKLNKYACKNADGDFVSCTPANMDFTKSPDFNKYVLKSDVQPCPAPPPQPTPAQLAADLKSNVSKYLSSAELQKMCKSSGFGDVSTNPDCAAHFLPGTSKYTLENFANYTGSGTYPQPHQFTDKWDIMLHKDYKYSDPTSGHMPKQECYATYAALDSSGKPIPNKLAQKSSTSSASSASTAHCKQLKEYKIQDHPDYESVLLKYGAVRDKCGKIVPAPPCPCLKRNACGDLERQSCPVHDKPQQKPAAKKCSPESECAASLMKEKLRFNLLLKRYKEVLKSVVGDRQDKIRYAGQIKTLKEQLEKLQSEIDAASDDKTRVSSVTAVCMPSSSSNVSDSYSKQQVQNLDVPFTGDSFAAAKPMQHGWNYN